jgi:hypothetical protein
MPNSRARGQYVGERPRRAARRTEIMAGSDNSASNRGLGFLSFFYCAGQSAQIMRSQIRWDLVTQHVEVLNIEAIRAVDLRQVNV